MNHPVMPGTKWHENGQSTLSGAVLDFVDRLDKKIVEYAGTLNAREFRFPTFIEAKKLEKLDYFRSFPHLVTFPVCLDDNERNLAEFTESNPVTKEGVVNTTKLREINEVLTPAACYHLYIHHENNFFHEKQVFTTKNTCFRREDHYVPLERQWSFTMREIVAMGTLEEVTEFLREGTGFMNELCRQLNLVTEWEKASDPFFQPSKNPQYLMQQIDPTKNELLFENRLAIGSSNLHHEHFGTAFSINRDDEDAIIPITSGCIAFGIERWLSAMFHQHGSDVSQWPWI